MKNRIVKGLMIALCIILVIVAGSLYFLDYFFSSFAPPKLMITKDYISTNTDFVNGLTIEKIKVDSIGKGNYPVKYTVIYMASCHILNQEVKKLDILNKIYFNKEGKYWWTEENVNFQFVHNGLSRKRMVSNSKPESIMGKLKYKTCPLKFEREQWYFITINNPQVTGIFFYIDLNGHEKQFYIKSGVSPI